MRLRLVLAALAAVILISACATVPPSQQENRVAQLIDLINSDATGIDEVVAQTNTPFLFQSELVVRSADVEIIWQRFRDEGVRFVPSAVPNRPASPSDYMNIADRFDLKVFFSSDGYVSDDAVWVTLDSSAGPFDLLIGGSENRLPMVLGLVGGDR